MQHACLNKAIELILSKPPETRAETETRTLVSCLMEHPFFKSVRAVTDDDLLCEQIMSRLQLQAVGKSETLIDSCSLCPVLPSFVPAFSPFLPSSLPSFLTPFLHSFLPSSFLPSSLLPSFLPLSYSSRAFRWGALCPLNERMRRGEYSACACFKSHIQPDVRNNDLARWERCGIQGLALLLPPPRWQISAADEIKGVSQKKVL